MAVFLSPPPNQHLGWMCRFVSSPWGFISEMSEWVTQQAQGVWERVCWNWDWQPEVAACFPSAAPSAPPVLSASTRLLPAVSSSTSLSLLLMCRLSIHVFFFPSSASLRTLLCPGLSINSPCAWVVKAARRPGAAVHFVLPRRARSEGFQDDCPYRIRLL